MMRTFFTLSLLMVLLAFLSGCDVGTNPIILDGADLTATFRIQSPLPAVSATQNVNLQSVVSEVKDIVDSISVYNVTIIMDSASSGNLALTAITSIDGTQLFTFNQTRIAAFAQERSVFDARLTGEGFSTNANGMRKLLTLLNPSGGASRQPTIVTVNGSSNQSPLSFRFSIKFYTQIYTTARH